MILETLPPEVLSDICNYIDVASLSFVSKRIRAVALKFILSSLKVSFPGDRFEAISGLLRQSNNSRHVRALVLEAEESDKATLQRLIEFLGCLTGLKSLECREDIALSLLTVWDQLPQCELFVRGFTVRGGLGRKDYQLDPKFRLLSAPFLTSLECDVCMRDLPRGSKVISYDEDDEDEEDEGSDQDADPERDQDILMDQAESLHFAKVVNFLTSVVPNLKRLDLRRNYRYGSIEIPKRRARKAKLVHLDLSGIGNPQRMLFEDLQKAIDFEALEILSLPNMSLFTYEWLDTTPMSLPGLKELKMYVKEGYMRSHEYVEDSWMYIENWLMKVPPLKRLVLVGDYNYVLGNCLERHSTLESLTLHERDNLLDVTFTSGIHLKLLDTIVQWENLTFLDIQVNRSRDDGIWKMLQRSRVEILILTLDCQVTGVNERFEHRKQILKYAATDAALARSIFDICGLERLIVIPTSTGAQAFNRQDLSTVRAVFQELTRSFEVTRVEGLVRVKAMIRNMLPVDKDAIKLDSEIMEVFRSLWPSKGGDWKDDWHSLPLVVDT